MKKFRRVMALLTAVILFASLPSNVIQAQDIDESIQPEGQMQSASDGENVGEVSPVDGEKETEAELEIPEKQQEASEVGIEDAAEQWNTADTLAMEVEKVQDSNVDYIYVQNGEVTDSREQNIVVAMKETAIAIESAELICQMSETGEIKNLSAEKIVDNTILFHEEYEANVVEHRQIIGITYKVQDDIIPKKIDFNEVQSVMFTVNTEEATQADGIDASDSVETTTYTVGEDELKEVATGTDAEEAVTQALEDVKDQAIPQVNMRTRAISPRTGDQFVIALDPGHDSHCGGAAANGLSEQVLTLKVAEYCKTELEKYDGVKIIMTRTDASCPNPQPGSYSSAKDIKARVQNAKAAGANAIISFHFNSATVNNANGVEIIYQNKSYDANIGEESKELAEKIYDQLVALGLNGRGIYYKDATDGSHDKEGNTDDYFTLHNEAKAQGIPGIIIEHAFLTGNRDSAKLKDENFLKQLGVADAKGIIEKYGLMNARPTEKDTKVEIVDIDAVNGKFTVKVSGKGISPTNVSQVRVPVWTDNNGGDDLSWYDASYNAAENAYEYTVDIAKHNNEEGKYYVHAYVFLKDGSNYSVGTSFVMEKVYVDIEKPYMQNGEGIIQLSSNQGSEYRAAVWTEGSNGKDLRWYSAEKLSDKKWSFRIPVNDYMAFGKYCADIYMVSNGTMVCVGSESFTVKKPQLKVSIQNYNASSGKCNIVVSDIKTDLGVASIKLPIWNVNDVSTMYWYEAVKQADGTYKMTFDIKNHKGLPGKYQAHVYIYCANGMLDSQNVGAFQVIAPEVGVKLTEVEPDMLYQVSVNNAGSYGDIAGVKCAAWSILGQGRDLKWYTAEQSKETGIWNAQLDIRNHNQFGEYYVDTYVYFKDGRSQYISTSKFNVTKPVMEAKVESYDMGTGIFTISVENIVSPSGVKEIRVPVWNVSDTSTMYWYVADKVEGNKYRVKGNIENHKYMPGIYQVHAYVFAKNGTQNSINIGSFDATLPETTVKIKSDNEINYTVNVSNVGLFGNVQRVQCAVWNKDEGRVVWYSAVQDEKTGVWSAVVPVNDFKKTGQYLVDTYVKLQDGRMQYIHTDNFEVSKPTATVKMGEYSILNGTRNIYIENIVAPAGVEKILVPVWSVNDVSNMYWYIADKKADGTYSVEVNLNKHKGLLGIYQAHVYIYEKNGVQDSMNAGTFEMKNPAKVMIKDVNADECVYRVSASNLFALGKVKEVKTAVWQQNDKEVKWYMAQQSASTGIWQSDIIIKDFGLSGDYQADTYAVMENGEVVCIDSSSFKVTLVKAEIVGGYSDETGNITVDISKLESVSGISGIECVVYNKKTPTEVRKYEAKPSDNKTYTLNANIRDFNFTTGEYALQVQVTAKNGVVVNKDIICHAVTPKLYGISGSSSVTSNQLVNWYKKTAGAATYPSEALGKGGVNSIEKFCDIYLEEAKKENIKGEIAFAQAMLETGWLRFGGAVKAEQYNFCGLGAIDSDPVNSSASFKDVREGIKAHIQHLKAYADKDPLNDELVDPRFHLVTRGSSPYVQWLGIKENPDGYGWATSKDYGIKIMEMVRKM